MDYSITLVTPAMNRQRGADAFDQGRSIDDHHMNLHTSALAISDWQRGWRERQREDREGRAWAARELMLALAEMP